MKNRTGRSVAPKVAPVIDFTDITDQLKVSEATNKSMVHRIESLIMRIASLEKTIESTNVQEEVVWEFDINRDIHGRMTDITAHKTGDKRVLM